MQPEDSSAPPRSRKALGLFFLLAGPCMVMAILALRGWSVEFDVYSVTFQVLSGSLEREEIEAKLELLPMIENAKIQPTNRQVTGIMRAKTEAEFAAQVGAIQVQAAADADLQLRFASASHHRMVITRKGTVVERFGTTAFSLSAASTGGSSEEK